MQTDLRPRLAYHYLLFFLLLSLGSYVQALSPAEAAEQAKTQTGGKVLKVKTLGEDDYKVKVLMPNGQVRSLSISEPTEQSDKENTPNK